MYSRKENDISQCNPRIPTPLCMCSWGQSHPCQEHTLQLYSSESLELPKAQSLSYTHCLKKPAPLSSPSCPVCGLRGFLVQTHCTLSTPLSLSPFSLPVESVPSPPQHGSFSLPQFTSMHFTPAMLSPSNHGNPFSNPEIYFLSVPSDLTSIQLCYRDKKSPGTPCFSVILTSPN